MIVRNTADLGLVIRERRVELKLSQEQLADRAGVGRQWIVDIEKGKPRAQVGLLLATLRALDLRLSVAPVSVEGSGVLDQILDAAHGDDDE